MACRTNTGSGSKAADAAATPATSSFTWNQTYRGKSSSSTTTSVQVSGNDLTIVSVRNWTNYSVGSGVTTTMLNKSAKTASVKRTADGKPDSTESYDGSSNDAAQQAGYQAVLTSLISSLNDNVDNPGAEVKTQRDAAVALLQKLLPDGSVPETTKLTWSITRPGKSRAGHRSKRVASLCHQPGALKF